MSPRGLRGADARFRPFLSSDLDAYLARYWAVVFTVGSRALETGYMRHYLSWYATRLKVVELDHHMHAISLRDQLITKAGTPALPILFVNQKLVGTIDDVRSYEERRLLKDIIQFGFQWKTGAALDGGPQQLNTLPSPYGDTELFRGRYRGAPVARPVVQLPQLHPHRRQED
ncbi:hypothetical protein LSCM4_05074 [Leishmania orientalis]|uniref:Thioredoxin-like protein n=1 Tax=Leishmania orientalis TaxID=2249476 RepID=A0A836H6U4_9TRYP|nr:hypothetical protein LSCM4_05074 [Leishmania orientalis]